MRAYRLHHASWSRIVTHRVRRPNSIASRLTSRRQPDQLVPADGQLVLLSCNHNTDPRSDTPVDRRELLDRIIEALSIPEVDGVIASADLLEELTLLNVLEHRLAICATSAGVPATAIAASNFDGGLVLQCSNINGPSQTWEVAASVAEFSAQSLPAIVDLRITDSQGNTGFDTSWNDWMEPLHATASAVATSAGVWIAVPALPGLSNLAEATGFPILIRDTDVPIHPGAWQAFFQSDLPLTVRGISAGVSALFPLEGTVAEATATIARAVRNRVTNPAPAA